MEITKEKSQEQADIIEEIKSHLVRLDIDYLKEFIKTFDDHNSFRESAVILSPNVHVQTAKNDYNRTVNMFARKLIELSEYRTNTMQAAYIAMIQAKTNDNILANIFK
jgi:hypothetical protein